MDKFKTGFQIGTMIEDAEVVGGASPNSLAVGTRYAYVSNATNDNISVIDYKNHKISVIFRSVLTSGLINIVVCCLSGWLCRQTKKHFMRPCLDSMPLQ